MASTTSASWSRRSPSGTRVALEHAEDQAEAIRDMLDDAVSYPDLADWDRITVGRVP